MGIAIYPDSRAATELLSNSTLPLVLLKTIWNILEPSQMFGSYAEFKLPPAPRVCPHTCALSPPTSGLALECPCLSPAGPRRPRLNQGPGDHRGANLRSEDTFLQTPEPGEGTEAGLAQELWALPEGTQLRV